MSLTLEPPPERPLPPDRYAAIRARVLTDIATGGTRRPRRTDRPARRWLMPAAAAAAVLVVAGGVITAEVARENRPSPSGSAPAQLLVEPVVPGYSNADLRQLRATCLKALEKDDDDPLQFGQDAAADRIDLASLIVYNVAVSDAGRVALLYGRDGGVTCSWDGYSSADHALTRAPNGTSWDQTDPRWLPGAASIDLHQHRDGGVADPQGGYPASRGYQQFGGRVPNRVARVEVTIDGTTVSVPALNGTYLATLWFPTTYRSHDLEPRIRTFDRENRPIGVYTRDTGTNSCLVTPDGKKQLAGAKRAHPETCTKAVPWQ